MAAATLLDLATEDAKSITVERDAEEREHALRSLGIEAGGTIPPALRSQLKAMEEDQKRRATRSLRDGIDRILVDLLSLYRDVLLIQLGAPDRAGQSRDQTRPGARRRVDGCRRRRWRCSTRSRPHGNASTATSLPRSRWKRCSSRRNEEPDMDRRPTRAHPRAWRSR